MSIDVFPATVLNSTLWNGQTYAEGTFTVTATGFSGTAPSGTAYYRRIGQQMMVLLPTLSGTSNATTFTITGIPAAIVPPLPIYTIVYVNDNGAVMTGYVRADTTTWAVSPITPSLAWTASGAKALWRPSITYPLF